MFSGGCTLDAAAEVAGTDLDVLASLVDKSLVRRTGERYWMLETIREFASGVLGHVDDAETLRRRHAEYLLALADTLGFTVEAIEAGATQRHDVALAEHNNVRAAIDWALHVDPVLALRLATTLENFWVSYSPFEASRMFDELVERAGGAPPELLALAARCRGNLAIFTGDVELGLQLYEDSLSQYERLGDEHAQAILEHRLGVNLFAVGERQRGQALLESSLERSQARGFRINEGMVRGTLGMAEYRKGNVERGLEMVLESVELARESGFRWWEVNNLNALAACMLELDRLAESEGYSRQAISVASVMGDRRHIVQSLAMLAAVAGRVGRARRAGVLWGAIETEERRGPLGHRPRMALWEHEREKFGPIVLANPGPELELGLKAGRILTLDQAVDEALASID